MGKLKDLTGQKFNKLTVLSFNRMRKNNSLWNCKCDCGIIKPLARPDLLSGNVKSCGCSKKGLSKLSLYRTATAQKGRCQNKKNSRYKDYGGRGIEFRFDSIQEATEYYKTLGDQPGPEYSLDRKDNDGHYEKGNIRWATPLQQNLNTRPRKNLTSIYRGVYLKKGKWIAGIHGKRHLGSFKSEISAASAYLEKYFELHKKWPPEYSKTPLCYKTPLHHLGLIT